VLIGDDPHFLDSKFTDRIKPISDSSALVLTINQKMAEVYSNGYLLASYFLKRQDSVFQIEFYFGKKYIWATLYKGNIPDYILNKIGYRQRFYEKKPFKQSEIKKLFNKTITEYENNGYPFASIRLDSIQIIDQNIFAKLNVEEGPEITLDDIKIIGTDKIKPKWLSVYLNLKKGSLFSQKAILEIDERIKKLPFVSLSQTPFVTFQNSQAIVNLPLKDEKANSFDGIVGFLPNDQEEGKLLITGQFQLGLNNLFSSGKSVDFKWQGLKPRSQVLNAQYHHPNVFKSKIDLKTTFNLLKEDTLFINREGSIAAVYNQPKYQWSLFYKTKNTSTLSDVVPNPDLADIKIKYYGTNYIYQNNLSNSILSSRWSFDITTAIGSKNISKNQNLPEETYSNIDLNSIQYILEGRVSKHFRIGKYLMFYQSISAGKIFNDNLFRNDLYRLGGLTTIRGFNENYFFASDYVISNLELQFYFQSNSYLFTFYDQSYLSYEVNSSFNEDYPLGLGIGIALKLNTGLLNIAYGVGKSSEQQLDFKLSKFHFGYVARF
jgi:outer membrane protein assembly factor BamA